MALAEIPPVRYLGTERGLIAYQRFGAEGRSIVWVSPPMMSIENRWWRPGDTQLWASLSSLGTVVLFDFRGLGSSSHLPLERVCRLEELRYDVEAVVEELAPAPTVLIATVSGLMAAVPFAVDRPDRVERLVLLNPVTTQRLGGNADPDALAADIAARWGTGALRAESAGLSPEPSQQWEMSRNERIIAPPDVAAAAVRAMAGENVRSLLDRVSVPTLVIHTGDIPAVTAEDVEAVAAAIPGARYLARPSSFFNWGEWDSDIHEFVTGRRPVSGAARDLGAVVFTDIVGSTVTASERGDTRWRETLERLDELVATVVAEERGRVVKQTGDGHLIEFARPGDALAAACRLVDRVGYLGVRLRVGVHFGEVERRPDGDIGGIAVHLAARIAAEAGAGEIVVSRTVAELTAGDGRTYTSRGTPPLKGIPGEWPILLLNR